MKPEPQNKPTPPARPQPVLSPEVGGDRRVAFRLRAPNAAEVVVTGQWPGGGAPMVKDEDGVWSVMVGPVDPGIWEYSFQLDGLSMIDPGNPAIKPMREPRTSILNIPGDSAQLTDFQDVPHGVVHQHTYFSKALGRQRELVVYTPPISGNLVVENYPTLYLQHGFGDNQATWTVHGKAHWILDNLIAQRLAKPMIVVMMDGHAVAPGTPDGIGAFERDLLQDVMPFVVENHNVETGAEHRALVGLSMGGHQALTIGLNHPDLFSRVGAFSAGIPGAEAISTALEDPDAINEKLKLIWIACGKDDFLFQRNVEFVELLNDKGIRHEWHLTEGDHSWPVWRTYLAQIAQVLWEE